MKLNNITNKDVKEIGLAIKGKDDLYYDCHLRSYYFERKLSYFAEISPSELGNVLQKKFNIHVGYDWWGKIDSIKEPGDLLFSKDRSLQKFISRLGESKEIDCRTNLRSR